jgi:hypothetical protein
MVLPGDATVLAFAEIGLTWGDWVAPADLMHFTATAN